MFGADSYPPVCLGRSWDGCEAKLRIGFVFDDSLDFPDGVQQYILMLGRELTKQGHDVHYLVGDTKRTDIANVHSLSKNMQVKFNRNIMRMPALANGKEIRRLLDEMDFDVLHVQAPFSPLMAGRVISQAPAETRIVSTFLIAPGSKIAQLGNKALGLLTRRPLRRIDSHIALSPVAAQLAKEAYGAKTQIIPSPVELEEFQEAAKAAAGQEENGDAKPKRILFLGRLVDRKRLDLLLDAVAQAETDPAFPGPDEVELIVAGDGPLREQLEQQAAGLRTPTKFLGFIDEDEKAPLLASADVVAFPSIGGESFGIVLVEACAAGAGVVFAGDNPGYRSTFADNQDVLVNPTDTRRFANLITRALTDQEFADRVHDWQQNHVKNFAAPRIVNQILEVYEGSNPKSLSPDTPASDGPTFDGPSPK